jgi:glucokinase-like ROK family protein
MTIARTADYAFVRELNLSVILNALRDLGPLSRAQLAARTGLNKTTVSSLVKELLDAEFVQEMGVHQVEDLGRPSVLLKLNPRAGYIIGAEIGVDFISVILANFEAEIVWRQQEQTTQITTQEAIIQRTMKVIREAFSEAERHRKPVLGLGLGVPGLVDVDTGTLLFAPNLGWRDVPLRSALSREYEFPIYVDNEANMATLGESYFGVARRARNVLYVSAGVGLGGGISVDGHILSGANGFAGEIGHMKMVPDGQNCNCGSKGCWETLVSQLAVIQRVREAIDKGQCSLLIERVNGDFSRLTLPLILQAAREGDQVALEAFEETGKYLGLGLANLINALNPETVVLGGIMSLASEFLMPVISRVIQEIALPWSWRGTKILVAAYGSDACVMGGVATVYRHILSEPKGLRARFRRNSRKEPLTTLALS